MANMNMIIHDVLEGAARETDAVLKGILAKFTA